MYCARTKYDYRQIPTIIDPFLNQTVSPGRSCIGNQHVVCCLTFFPLFLKVVKSARVTGRKAAYLPGDMYCLSTRGVALPLPIDTLVDKEAKAAAVARCHRRGLHASIVQPRTGPPVFVHFRS